ncbi:hypothetical protein FRX31_022452 [Thalictrum thalictroides]|uniref:Uncharacterized protein n=1 Tax=Thalictrum thalictroides TaxID=46969 RepID=A0A7J6VT55_THATH|nr:hypothetical protein FRX31_022452 [Thalictrum thalictroides]
MDMRNGGGAYCNFKEKTKNRKEEYRYHTLCVQLSLLERRDFMCVVSSTRILQNFDARYGLY